MSQGSSGHYQSPCHLRYRRPLLLVLDRRAVVDSGGVNFLQHGGSPPMLRTLHMSYLKLDKPSNGASAMMPFTCHAQGDAEDPDMHGMPRHGSSD